jgi:hypothetical protein
MRHTKFAFRILHLWGAVLFLCGNASSTIAFTGTVTLSSRSKFGFNQISPSHHFIIKIEVRIQPNQSKSSPRTSFYQCDASWFTLRLQWGKRWAREKGGQNQKSMRFRSAGRYPSTTKTIQYLYKYLTNPAQTWSTNSSNALLSYARI